MKLANSSRPVHSLTVHLVRSAELSCSCLCRLVVVVVLSLFDCCCDPRALTIPLRVMREFFHSCVDVCGCLWMHACNVDVCGSTCVHKHPQWMNVDPQTSTWTFVDACGALWIHKRPHCTRASTNIHKHPQTSTQE